MLINNLGRKLLPKVKKCENVQKKCPFSKMSKKIPVFKIVHFQKSTKIKQKYNK